MKRKYLLFAFILSFFIFNLVNAEELYNLDFKTKEVSEKAITNTYYNNGYLTANVNYDGEYTRLTTYDLEGNILKEKKLYDQEIMSVAVNNENIYALVVDYSDAPIIYLKEFDSDLKEVKSITWLEDEEDIQLIEMNYSLSQLYKSNTNYHMLVVKDNKIYSGEFFYGSNHLSEFLIKSYDLNLSNEETKEISANNNNQDEFIKLMQEIGNTFTEFKYVDLYYENNDLLDNPGKMGFYSYNNNHYYMAYYHEDEDTENYIPMLNLYDKDLKIVKELTFDDNLSIEYVALTSNNLFVELYNDDTEKAYLNIYDLQGNLVQTINNLGIITNLEETPKGIILSENTSDDEDEYLTTHNIYYLKRTVTTNVISGNGTITVPENISTGDLVTITVNPENGYVLGEIKVTDATGNEIKVTNNTFTMPASNVKIEATFIKSVLNPETSDIAIISVIILFFITGFILYKQKQKLNFLK